MYWNYGGPKGQKDPRTIDAHLVYLRKQYYAAVTCKGKVKVEKRFDCINSWGFTKPIVEIKCDDPSIIQIFKIIPHVRLLSKPKYSEGDTNKNQRPTTEDRTWERLDAGKIHAVNKDIETMHQD